MNAKNPNRMEGVFCCTNYVALPLAAGERFELSALLWIRYELDSVSCTSFGD
jgi:hypothetical protein